MRRGLLLALAAAALAVPVPAGQAASCTAAQKRAAQGALAKYRKQMAKQRAAYFRTHRSPKLRRAFTKRQQVKLKKLRAAASCRVVPPATPPPPPPPPPPDTTPPQLASAFVDGASVSVAFTEDVTLGDASFTVHVNGATAALQTASASGPTVTLTLTGSVGGDDIVRLDYAGGVRDAAGNSAAPASGVVVANATPSPCAFTVAGPGSSTGPPHHEGPTDLSLFEPSLGELHGIVLWIDFPDAPATESIATLTERLIPPAASAYSSMSYGKFALRLDAAARWYRLPQASTYYGLNAADGAGRKDEYIAAAVQAADADVDFSRYRVVYLVASVGASANMTTATQRPPGSGLVAVDGVEVRHAVLIGTDRLQQPGHGSEGVGHETGHVLGLPDLYGDPTAVGGWDPMSFNIRPNAELLGWHRWKLKWLDPPQLRCVQPGRTVQATLAPLETPGGVKMVVAPLDATRALVVENRQPLGLDARLCDKGVLVYTVDGSIRFPGAPIRILAAHPGTDTDGALLERCGPRYDAPLDIGAGEVSALTDVASGVHVQVVAAAGGTYVVRVAR